MQLRSGLPSITLTKLLKESISTKNLESKMNLTGKNVVFVGGLGAIGYETCKQLMTKNIAYLTILDALENPKAVQQLQTINPKTKVVYMKFDITNKSSIQRAIAEVVAETQYIDVLVNGAGIVSDRNVELTLNINLVGLINTTMEALPYMDKTRNGRGGTIVNIASVLGLEPCGPIAVYSASKFGVIGFTRSMADPHYHNVTGIVVMAICPGLTETPLKNHIADRDTFDYSRPITDKLLMAKVQTPAACAVSFVRAIEANTNGGMWICDLGTLKLVEPKVFWQPKF